MLCAMSFNRTQRYQDTITSSAKTHHNAFRQDPWASKSYMAQKSGQADSLETNQQKMERELLDKFRQNHFRLSSGGITLLAHLGKGLVLILIMPPYFLFVKAPKFLMMGLYPAVALIKNTILPFTGRVSAWTGDVFAIAYQRMLTMLRKLRMPKWPKLKVKKTEIPFKNHFKKFDEALTKRLEQAMHLFQKVRNPFHSIKNRFTEFAARLKENVQNGLQWGTIKFKEQVFQFSTRLGAKAQKALLKTSSVVKYAGKKAGEVIDTTIEKLVVVLAPPVAASLKLIKWAVAPLLQIPSQMALLISPPLQFIGSKFKNSVAVLQKGSALASIARDVFKSAFGTLLQSTRQIEAAVVSFASKAAYHLVHQGKRVASKMVEILKSLSEGGKRGGKKLLRFAKQKSLMIAQSALKALFIIKKLPSLLWIILSIIFHLLRRGFHLLRILYASIKVLVRHSLEQLDGSHHMKQ